MIAAVAVFSFMDGVLKFFAMRYPPMEVAALRGATSLPFTLAPVLIAGRLRDLMPRRWPMHRCWWRRYRCRCCVSGSTGVTGWRS